MHAAIPSRNGTTVNNHSTGTVGIQAGNISGTNNVYMDPRGSERAAPADLADLLSDVRDRLARGRTAGSIDTATHDAAGTELDLAARALAAGEADAVLIPLRRLRGLVAGAPELEASVDGLLSTARSSS